MQADADDHWLRRFSADEWLRAGMHELSVAKEHLARHATRPGLASARRAAGMGWNAVLTLSTTVDGRFGRTYVEHLRALADGVAPADASALPLPDEVRTAARRLLDDPAGGPRDVVSLQLPSRDARLAEAAETVLAEAWARVTRARALAAIR
jgi:hypothetical protein